jgi:diphthamide synthase subunit DPH2
MYSVEATVVKKIKKVLSNKPVYRMIVKIDSTSEQYIEAVNNVEVRCQKDCPSSGKVKIQVYKVPLLNYRNYFYNGT